jgi:hypothetical protein
MCLAGLVGAVVAVVLPLLHEVFHMQKILLNSITKGSVDYTPVVAVLCLLYVSFQLESSQLPVTPLRAQAHTLQCQQTAFIFCLDLSKSFPLFQLPPVLSSSSCLSVLHFYMFPVYQQ